MTIKKFIFSFFALLIVFSFPVSGHEKTWPERRLKQSWPEADIFTSKQITLTSSQIAELKTDGIVVNFKDRSPIFYLAQIKDTATKKLSNLGVIIFIDESGDNGVMEISVAMGSDGLIKKINIWENSENSFVAKDDFLKQFVGKSAKDSFEIENDYKPVPKAPKASVAVAKAAQKALKISSQVFKKK